jgi:hypothetical protein
MRTVALPLRVATQPRQIFGGFGAGQTPKSPLAGAAPGDWQSVYRGGGMNTVRLGVQMTDAQQHLRALADLIAGFRSSYTTGGILAELQAEGVSTLLLAPSSNGQPAAEGEVAYATLLAQLIGALRQQDGIRFSATGFCDAPDVASYGAAELASGVASLRSALDGLGLQDVGIVGLETVGPDAAASAAVSGQPAAWSALRGLASESFAACADGSDGRRALAAGKELWITSAGSGPPGQVRSAADTRWATAAAGQLLNDLNQGATRWIWSVGVDPGGASAYALAAGGESLPTLGYLGQARRAFDVGAVIRPVATAWGDPYVWGPARPPAAMAAARNPDGTWSAGIVNATGIAGAEPGTFYPPEPITLEVSIAFSDLTTSPDTLFRVWRSNADEAEVEEAPVTLQGGVLTIEVHPQELVTVRSEP